MKTTTNNNVTYLVGFKHSKNGTSTTCLIRAVYKDYEPTLASVATVRRFSGDTPNRVIGNRAAFDKAVSKLSGDAKIAVQALGDELRSPKPPRVKVPYQPMNSQEFVQCVYEALKHYNKPAFNLSFDGDQNSCEVIATIGKASFVISSNTIDNDKADTVLNAV